MITRRKFLKWLGILKKPVLKPGQAVYIDPETGWYTPINSESGKIPYGVAISDSQVITHGVIEINASAVKAPPIYLTGVPPFPEISGNHDED